MKSFIKNIINQTGFEIKRKHPIDSRAKAIFERYHTFTMVPQGLFVENLKLVWEFRHVKGCVVECGVWRGGMSAGIAEILNDKNFYLFDSFEGLPEAKEIDGARAISWQKNTSGKTYYDNCKAEMSYAENAMKKSGAKYQLVKGWFNETLPATKLSDPISILRLDGDWYDSTMDSLVNLFPQVTKGGLIILDDYYTWDGCSRAVHDYLSRNSSVTRIFKTPSGIPYLVKMD